jgi:hypothetical protein
LQCSACHETESWAFSGYDHADANNCLTCHSAPSAHWIGQCSNCHTTGGSWGDVTFDHQTYATYTDCKSCHVQTSSHPRAQCSVCHNTDTWLTTFNQPFYRHRPFHRHQR